MHYRSLLQLCARLLHLFNVLDVGSFLQVLAFYHIWVRHHPVWARCSRHIQTQRPTREPRHEALELVLVGALDELGVPASAYDVSISFHQLLFDLLWGDSLVLCATSTVQFKRILEINVFLVHCVDQLPILRVEQPLLRLPLCVCLNRVEANLLHHLVPVVGSVSISMLCYRRDPILVERKNTLERRHHGPQVVALLPFEECPALEIRAGHLVQNPA